MKKENKKGNSKSDSINFNNQVQRTITIWHGNVEEQQRIINGVLMRKYAPSRGIRSVTVHPSCNDSAEKIAYNLNGYIPTQTQMNELKWVEVPVEVELAQ